MNTTKNLLEIKKYLESHENIIYSMFISLCDPKKESIYRSDFMIPFLKLNQSDLNLNEDFFDNFHIQIDYDKDGCINFNDFFQFIMTHLYMMIRNLNNGNSKINKLNCIKILGSKNDYINFSNIITNIYYGIILNNNFFSLVDLFQNNFLDYHIKFCNILNPKGFIIEKTSDFKLNAFNQMILSLSNLNLLIQITNNLNSSDMTLFSNTLNQFKILLKPINYITSIFQIAINYKNIIQILINLATCGILQKILVLITSIGYNTINGFLNLNTHIIYDLLKINKRILYLANYIKKTFLYCNNVNYKYLYNYVKKNSNDTINFLTFIKENLIPQILLKLNFCLETYNNFNIEHITYQIILEISKFSIEMFSSVLTNTHYLNWLTTKTKILHDDINNPNLNINFFNGNSNPNIIIGFQNGIISLNHLFYNCINLIETSFCYNNESEDNININQLIVNTFSTIMNDFQNIFIKLNSILSQLNPNNNNEYYYLHQKMYIVLISLFSFIGDFDDRLFILKLFESKIFLQKKFIFIPSLNFYFKCLLINEKNILSLIKELKILNIFSEYYINEDYNEINDFFELLRIIVESNSSNLKISNLTSDIILIFSNCFTEINDNYVKNNIIEFLYILSSYNDILINDICSNSNLITNVISHMYETWIEKNNFSKKNDRSFNVKLIFHGCMFIYNLTKSENNKGIKFLSKISKENINNLYELSLCLCILSCSESNVKNLNEDEKQYKKICFLYNKYRNYAKVDILLILIKIFENLNESFSKNEEENDIFSNISEYIKNCIINIKIKIRVCGVEFDLKNKNGNSSFNINEKIIKPIPILKLFTQNSTEKKNDRCSLFEYSSEKFDYNNFINSIKNNYNCDIDLYLVSNDCNVKIKDENDFIKIFNQIFELYNKSEEIKDSIAVWFFVVEKIIFSNNNIYCVNCGKKIDFEKKTILNDSTIIYENNRNDTSNLCEDCKNMFLKQIECQITLNKSINLNNNILVDSKRILPYSIVNGSSFNNNINNISNPYATPSTKQLSFNQISEIKKANNSDFLSSACPLRILSKTIYENKDENND